MRFVILRPVSVRLRPLALLCCWLLASGCAGLFSTGADEKAAEKARHRAQALRTQLRDAVLGFAGAIELTGRRVAADMQRIEHARNTLHMRVQTIRSAWSTLDTEEPSTGWIDLWALCLQLEQLLAREAGPRLFGEQAAQLRAAVTEQRELIERHLREVAGTDEVFLRARANVVEFVEANPMHDTFARIGIHSDDLREEKRKDALGWLPTVNLNPFATVGEGISETAAAIYAIESAGERFSNVVELLPLQLGWTLDGLRYDIQAEGVVQGLDQHLARFNESAATIAQTAKALPHELRTEVDALLASTGPQIDALRATLAEVDRAAAGLDKVGTTFGQTATNIEGMAAQLDTTLQTFQRTLQQLEGEPEPEGAAPGKPFDILEFDQTARSLTAMAAQLDTTLGSFRELVAENRLQTTVATVTEETGTEIRQVIWTAAIAIAALLVLGFALAFAYRRSARHS